VFLTKEVDGMVAKLPSATRNMYVDGELSPLSPVHFHPSPSTIGASPGSNKSKDGDVWIRGDGEMKEEVANEQAPRLGPTRLDVRILDDLYMHIPPLHHSR